MSKTELRKLDVDEQMGYLGCEETDDEPALIGYIDDRKGEHQYLCITDLTGLYLEKMSKADCGEKTHQWGCIYIDYNSSKNIYGFLNPDNINDFFKSLSREDM